MDSNSELMADVLAAEAPGEPSATDLVAYASDASALSAEQRVRVERYLAASAQNRDRFRAIAPEDWTLLGSCLCGQVRYAAAAARAAIGHCHCQRCRKAHGAAFGSFALVRSDTFAWRGGAEHLARFGGDGDQSISFCKNCGTTLTGNAPPGRVALAIGTLDVDPVARPTLHAHVDQRVPWLEIQDDVTQLPGPFEGFSPHEPRDGETLR